MRARFVGGSLDGKERDDTRGAHHFMVPIPKRQTMTAARMIELLAMHWEDRPVVKSDLEFYNRTLERDASGKLVGFVYVYDRTEER